jgi:hypothetical protein
MSRVVMVVAPGAGFGPQVERPAVTAGGGDVVIVIRGGDTLR